MYVFELFRFQGVDVYFTMNGLRGETSKKLICSWVRVCALPAPPSGILRVRCGVSDIVVATFVATYPPPRPQSLYGYRISPSGRL